MFDADELTRRQIGEALYHVGEGLRQLGVALGAHIETKSTAENTTDQAIEGKKKRKRAPKDPNAPKRFVGSYIHFANEHREQVKADHPEANQKEVVQMLGEMWKALSESEKDRYKRIYEEDKVRYEKELEEYKGHAVEEPQETVFTPTPETTNESESSESSEEEEDNGKETVSLKQPSPPKTTVPEKKAAKKQPAKETKQAKETSPVATKKAAPPKKDSVNGNKPAKSLKRAKKTGTDEGSSEKQTKKKAKKVNKE
ncbi:hypothetical protein EC973_008834 [Apophysomyces ossiformis]|uniref:HMG box domain-containing protein n=1 Tax=Apophysomyces ossiformis TaxID=679940 RepID=A0A8H7ESP7_9FUNG|nr:hypothetical protein EC973_008834 [Apophysomyces ossiformis]